MKARLAIVIVLAAAAMARGAAAGAADGASSETTATGPRKPTITYWKVAISIERIGLPDSTALGTPPAAARSRTRLLVGRHAAMAATLPFWPLSNPEENPRRGRGRPAWPSVIRGKALGRRRADSRLLVSPAVPRVQLLDYQ